MSKQLVRNGFNSHEVHLAAKKIKEIVDKSQVLKVNIRQQCLKMEKETGIFAETIRSCYKRHYKERKNENCV